MGLACWWEGLRGRPIAHIGPADELAQDGIVCRDAADEQRGVGVREEEQLARVGRAQRLVRVHDQPHWVRVRVSVRARVRVREGGCSSRLRARLWRKRSGSSCGQRHGRSVQAKQAPTRRHLANRQSSCLEASSPNRSSGGAAWISAGVRCWLPLRLTSTAASCRSSLARGDASIRDGSPPSQAYRTHPRRTSSTNARSSTRAEAIFWRARNGLGTGRAGVVPGA